MCTERSGIRLLMVDDEREFLESMERGLKRRGFEVTSVESGREALGLAESCSFDAVLLDVKMPGLDGVDVFRRLRERWPGLPVVLLTGHGNLEQAFETSREGVQEYLAKPCDVDTLARVLRDVVERTMPTCVTGEGTGREVSVLLVDDDEDFVRAMSAPLERRGLSVTPAHDGREAIERVRSRSFEVAVVDVVMPGMNGLTLLERLREEDPLLEVVVLTGNPRVGDVRRGFQAGAYDYLVKPCSVEDLVRVVRAAGDRRLARSADMLHASAEEILRRRPD